MVAAFRTYIRKFWTIHEDFLATCIWSQNFMEIQFVASKL